MHQKVIYLKKIRDILSFLFNMDLLDICMVNLDPYTIHLEALPKEWVVIRLSSLGDVVLTTGVLEYWHTCFQWNFTAVTQESIAPIFKNNPAIQHIVALNKEQLTPKNILPCLITLAKSYRNYGLIDLHRTFKTRLLSLFWQGPTYCYPKMNLERRLFLITKGRLFKRKLNKWNIPQRYAKSLEVHPPRAEDLIPNIVLLKEECDKANQAISHIASSNQKIVALHPYSIHKNKAWRDTGWRNLIENLTLEGIPWFVIGHGTPMKNLPQKNDFTNKTTLRESCALLHRASVLITGDSGPMHLAIATKTPVIALFGPTTKDWGFFPIEGKNIILETALPCRPCSLHGEKRCPFNHICMEKITPIQIMAALKKILESPSKNHI